VPGSLVRVHDSDALRVVDKAAEALAAGCGGIIAVARINGIARSTIGRGLAELRGEAEPEAAPGRMRPGMAETARLSDFAFINPATDTDGTPADAPGQQGLLEGLCPSSEFLRH
jgi:hypothetical protein